MKVDLTMWVKNGAYFLPSVLKRIDEVIPQENINKKIFVDDHSVDNSIEIAERYGWRVYENPEGGIPSGANEALRHVAAPFFISIEQDILLAHDWWPKISKHMANPKVAIAQGTRIYTHPVLKALEEYYSSRIKAFPGGGSLDNNLFRTKAIRELGDFPSKCPFCTEIYLRDKIEEKSYIWVIDENAKSLHIRNSLKNELERVGNVIRKCRCPKKYEGSRPKIIAGLIFVKSPIRALQIAIQKHCPNIAWFYPIYRLQILKSILSRK